ncbi:MAG: glycosyltransferase [Anaerolineaceae bacterium]|jgi:glycosyltransferase involved in cell wall biosynthesis
MKIAVITTSQAPASSANSIQAFKVCQALAQVDGPVRLWLPGSQAVPWERLADYYGLHTPLDIRWLPSRRLLRRYDFALAALREARAWGAQVIYTWTAQAALLALYLKLPVIYEVHDRPSGRVGPWLFRRIVRTPGKKRLLVITEALRLRLEQQFGLPLPPDLAQIAPSGVDLERYELLPEPAAARGALGLPERLTVGYIGHLYAGRGMHLLQRLAERFPQVQFLWVGGKPEHVALWQSKLAAAEASNVILTGFVANSKVSLYQAACEVLLMPYERSVAVSGGGDTADVCSPMKMFDYMAAGRAILSSDLPVLHEALNEGNAVFCPPEDPAAWEAALGRLLADPAYRAALAEQARHDVKRYTLQERARRALDGFHR